MLDPKSWRYAEAWTSGCQHRRRHYGKQQYATPKASYSIPSTSVDGQGCVSGGSIAHELDWKPMRPLAGCSRGGIDLYIDAICPSLWCVEHSSALRSCDIN